MGNVYPSQVRRVDPFESYNSNIVNSLTRMVSDDTNCLFSTHAIDVMADSTSPLDHVLVTTGQCFKDDVIVRIVDEFRVDFTDVDFYIDTSIWNAPGYYYVVLEYTYVKARPAPQAAIKILKPSEHALLTSAYLFLKAVYVSNPGAGVYQIDSLHDYDPNETSNRRLYSPLFAGVEDRLPTFVTAQHEGKIIYCRSEDALYYGASGHWEEFSAIKDNITTTGCSIGQLVYVGTDGAAHPAISTDRAYFADAAVLQVGTGATGDGQVRLYGRVDNVPVEPGRVITVGENVYLSETTAGAITDLVPVPISQFVGTCVATDGTSHVDIWFMPGSEAGEDIGISWYDRYQDLLMNSIYTRMTVDTFINLDYVDQINTTAQIDTVNHEIDGDVGETFRSGNLTEAGYDGTCIVSCQVSMVTRGGPITIYVSNNGNQEWEPCVLDQIHTFSTHRVPITWDGTCRVNVGEVTTGGTSGKIAIVAGYGSDYILLHSVTKTSNYIVGEQLTGFDSGCTATVTAIEIERNYIDLRVRADFSGTGAIEDYGVLYDEDTTLTETVPNNELNIDTLFADLYATPSQDNDGIANLAVPLESQARNLRDFVGSDGAYDITPNYLSTDIVDQSSNIVIAISKLDEKIAFPSEGRWCSDGDTTPSIYDTAGKRCASLILVNSSLTTVTNFDDATGVLVLVVYFTTDNTVIEHNDARIHLAYGADFKAKAGDILVLVHGIGIWREVSRKRVEEPVEQFGPDDKTPSVKGADIWETIDSTAVTAITNFDDGYVGQKLTVIFTGPDVQINHSANIHLQGGSNFRGSIYDTISFVKTSTTWIETGRSVNS